MRRLAGLLLVVAALAGCGDRAAVRDGGRAPGEILTVYVLHDAGDPAAPDFLRGAKLALSEAGGAAGSFTVQFAAKALPAGTDAAADAVEAVVRDVATIAVVSDLDAPATRVSAPLLNAVGLLQVGAGPAVAGVAQPARQQTFFALGLPATAAPPPGFAEAYDGLGPGPRAGAGFDAMTAVLAALERAGARATIRSEVIRSFDTSGS